MSTRTDLKNSVKRKKGTGMRSIYIQHHLFILKSHIYKQIVCLPRIHTYPRKTMIYIRGGAYGNVRTNENAVGSDDGVM